MLDVVGLGSGRYDRQNAPANGPGSDPESYDLAFPPVVADSIIVEGFGGHRNCVGQLTIGDR